MKVKRGDTVLVTAGKEKDKQGKILLVDRKNDRVIVEGVNMIKKHQKPSAINPSGGIITKEAPIHVSNVMYLHNGKPSKLGYKVEVVDGKKVKKRVVKKTGEVID
ncbi:MAG: 50S ribosomal protein L24 [bacterium]